MSLWIGVPKLAMMGVRIQTAVCAAQCVHIRPCWVCRCQFNTCQVPWLCSLTAFYTFIVAASNVRTSQDTFSSLKYCFIDLNEDIYFGLIILFRWEEKQYHHKAFLLTEWPSCSNCCHRNRRVLNYELFLRNPSCRNLPNCYFETVLLNDFFSPPVALEVIQFILMPALSPFVSVNALPTPASLIMVLFCVLS